MEVFAEDTGMPEGLCRVYDILQSAIAPTKITNKANIDAIADKDAEEVVVS